MLLPISGTYWQQLQRWLPTPCIGHRPLPHGPWTTNLPSFLKDSSIPIQAGESETHATYLLVLSQPFLGAACVFFFFFRGYEQWRGVFLFLSLFGASKDFWVYFDPHKLERNDSQLFSEAGWRINFRLGYRLTFRHQLVSYLLDVFPTITRTDEHFTAPKTRLNFVRKKRTKHWLPSRPVIN